MEAPPYHVCTKMQPIAGADTTQCDAFPLRPPSQLDSVPLAYELAEPRIVAQLPPPPVVTRGEPDAVLGVRRHVLLQQLERLVAVSEQQPDERLVGGQLALAIDLRVDA